jgi:acetyl-CoA carboxylase biotin carboxylase subunit
MYVPGGMGVRFDSHVHPGYTVPPFYDSMIGKLLVFQPTREQAIEKMLRALSELRIKGIETTAGFLATVVQLDEFRQGKIDTKFVERTMDQWY